MYIQINALPWSDLALVDLPDVKERMAGEGVEPVGGPPERFLEVLKRDMAKWQNVVKIANIKPGS